MFGNKAGLCSLQPPANKAHGQHDSFTSYTVHVDSAADNLGFGARASSAQSSDPRTLTRRTLLAIPVPEPVVVVPLPAVPYCDRMHRTKSATTTHTGASALPNAYDNRQ